MRCGTHTTLQRDKKCLKILIGKPERKIELGETRLRLEDDFNKDLGKPSGRICTGLL
jgi:hypothetical protein